MVKAFIKRLILRYIPSFGIKSEIEKKEQEKIDSLLSYSQEGEDKVLARFFEYKNIGFYIDIGAHHPIRFSNTYLFYKRGWRGINIDAMPGSMEAFREIRTEDINLEIPIASKREFLNYYIFNETALNTFSKEEAEKKDGLRNYKVIKTLQLEAFPLSEILDKYLPSGQHIDFMSIDVEGYDFEVLKSNNWEMYKPDFILIESLRTTLEEIKEDKVYLFLKDYGYKLQAKTFNTLFFQRED